MSLIPSGKSPSNIKSEQVVSNMSTEVAIEVPIHLNQHEEALLSLFLKITGFTSLGTLLGDMDLFLNEELD